MAKPLLQLALDSLTIEEAIASVEKVKKEIDIIEVGTILIAAEGKKAIATLAKLYPDKIIVADGKIADAGKVFGKMFFDAGANFTTCICAAEIETIKSVLDCTKDYSKPKEVQIELTSNFQWSQVENWQKIGVTQVVYHRSRDSQLAGATWTKKDLFQIQKLIDLGFKVSVTGGIEVEDLKLFAKMPIYIFIAGRSLREAENPVQNAAAFQAELNKYWS